MNAVILDISPQTLTVRNLANNETVIVNFRNTRRFTIGDRIRITYSGIATMSIPPQITASNIQLISSAPITPPNRPNRPTPPFQPFPPFPINPPIFPQQREIRAFVLSRENNFLIVRNNANGQILRVDTRDARFFCPGRAAIIRHNGIMPGLPPRVIATEVLPIC